ncbi:MAG: hypothetical protein WAO76_13360, partial [Georgfuchsia sp.]
MSRSTAPSEWLPGFDPEAPAPSPAKQASPSLPGLSNSSGEMECIENTSDADSGHDEQQPAIVRTNWRIATTTVEPAPRVLWPQLTSADLTHLTGATAKFEANLAAITLLRQVETENRTASADERQTLLRYTGWGGLPASFNLDTTDNAWLERARRLQMILSAEDYESALASVNNSHYTEVHVIEAIWQAVERFGF